jgi:hypothetical protein
MGMSIDKAIEHGKEQLEIFGGEHKEFIECAVETMRKYQQLQADYENRLKADMVAMLTELSMTIGEIEDGYTEFDDENKRSLTMIPLESVDRTIQQKINELEGGNNEQKQKA